MFYNSASDQHRHRQVACTVRSRQAELGPSAGLAPQVVVRVGICLLVMRESLLQGHFTEGCREQS